MLSLDLSVEFIDMVITAGGATMFLLNITIALALGPLLILMEQIWWCVNALSE